MNRSQRKTLWITSILLSVVAFFGGIASGVILLAFVVPIVLIGGTAFVANAGKNDGDD